MTSNRKKIDPFTPDEDNPKWTKKDFKKARPAAEVFKELSIEPPRPVGRPPTDNPKVSVTIRLDREVVEHFKKEGKGWQTRVNATLKRELKKMPNHDKR